MSDGYGGVKNADSTKTKQQQQRCLSKSNPVANDREQRFKISYRGIFHLALITSFEPKEKEYHGL